MTKTMGDEERVARPIPVSREIYVAFGNKCRSNGYEVRKVLEVIMQSYIKDDSVFKI